MRIPIAKPQIGEAEKHAVLEVLASGQLSEGPKVAQFERAFADYHGAKHGVAVCNGTAALMVALMAHGIGPGDEVIVPSFSFFATAGCVFSVGARPVFADIDPASFCLRVEAAEAAITARSRAIIPVHLYGLPAQMPRFEALCDQHGLVLIEDAAQAHGAAIGSRRVGTWGTAAFSFYPTKNMTTTEGGMVLTHDAAVASRIRLIRHQGMSQGYRHEVVGYNFRMTEMAAAIGLVQLGCLPGWTRQRQQNAAYFQERLRRVKTPQVEPGFAHVYHQYTVRVPDGADRDRVLDHLHQRGIGARVYYPTPIHRQPVFQGKTEYSRVDLPETDRAAHEVLSLPVYPALSRSELAYIADEVNAAC